MSHSNNIPATSHTKAAEAHEMAAKTHRSAADLHTKGDNKTGLAHAEKAVKQSETAHDCCQDAHTKSKTAAH